MKRLLLLILSAVLLCSCESSAVKQGRKAYEYRLSCLYYEYVVDKEMIVSELGGQVEYSVITRVREKDGEPYKPKAFRFICKDGQVVSQN